MLLTFVLATLLILTNSFANVIHHFRPGETLEDARRLYADQLGQSDLKELNRHLDQLRAIPRMELIVNPRVEIINCRFTVKKGDNLANILKKFSYENIYSLGLFHYAKRQNSHIEDINAVFPGDKLNLPLVAVKSADKHFSENAACETIFQRDRRSSFIIRDRHAVLGPINTPNANKREVASASPAPERDNVRSDSWTAVTGYIFDSLNGTKDSDSVIVGTSRLRLGASWKQNWSDTWSTRAGANLYLAEYSPDPEEETIKTNKTVQNELYIGLGINFSPGHSWSFSTGKADKLYYKQTSEEVFEILKDQNFFARLEGEQKLLSRGALSLSLLERLSYYSEGSLGHKGGSGLGAGFKVGREISDKKLLEWTLLYRQEDMKTKWHEFTHRWLEFNLAITGAF